MTHIKDGVEPGSLLLLPSPERFARDVEELEALKEFCLNNCVTLATVQLRARYVCMICV